MLKTFIVSATYRFDWLHFLVKAEDFESAKKKVEETFNDSNCSDYNNIRQIIMKSDDFVDFYVDIDDIEYGSQYFEVCDYEMEFTVRVSKDESVDFLTQEEALSFVKGRPNRVFTNRAYYYELLGNFVKLKDGRILRLCNGSHQPDNVKAYIDGAYFEVFANKDIVAFANTKEELENLK